MSGWIFVVDRIGDFKGDPDGRQLVTARDYIARPPTLKGGDAKVALDLAISMISEGLSDESEKAEAMNYLRIAEKSPDLKIKTVAATVGRSLQAAQVTEIEVSQ